MTSLDTLPETVLRTPLLAGVCDIQRSEILSAMVARRFAPGEVILRQETLTHNLWIILAGRCEVIKEPPLERQGKPVKLADLGPGETFGEMSMFSDVTHCTSVWSATEVETLKLRRSDFDRLMESHPVAACRLACNVVNLLSDRLRRMDDWLSRLLDEHEAMVAEQQWQSVRQRIERKFQGYLV